ncbi:DNA polymerase III subunit delta' [Naasia lichenicola]|uniref:DNA polymerase III subunit delta n=1 Tax=Naasia lichenicola TaxID=2565933 RepID=A0A4S4FMS3_9MICO|nr:DNA polymerase III subunit delta' [Naasia lichenicola]
MWSGLVGQTDAIATMRQASDSARTGEGSIGAMTHSWLITGPPGSGRSNLAYAFATALLSDGTPEGDARTRAMVAARTHPDLAVLSTERVIISIEEVRGLLSSSQYSPSVARYRVMVIEDADRMTERTSNLLLKALEEPPPRTVWILCAPSEADLLPTIRSRVRVVRLRTPEAADVAQLLVERDGVDPELALAVAYESQSHIGMAHRLATDADARARRAETLDVVLGLDSVSAAVHAAARLLAIAGDDAKAITEQKDAEERASALRSLGVEPGGTVPPALRSQLKALEEDQKRRATRSLRDGIDRILVDLLSLYRDILLEQLHAGLEPVNVTARDAIARAAAASDETRTLAIMDAIATARRRIEANVPPALALEAMLVAARTVRA